MNACRHKPRLIILLRFQTNIPSTPLPLWIYLSFFTLKEHLTLITFQLEDVALVTKFSIYHQVIVRCWFQLFLMVHFTRQLFHTSLNSNYTTCAPFLIYCR